MVCRSDHTWSWQVVRRFRCLLAPSGGDRRSVATRCGSSRKRSGFAGAGSLAIPRAVTHGLAACRRLTIGNDCRVNDRVQRFRIALLHRGQTRRGSSDATNWLSSESRRERSQKARRRPATYRVLSVTSLTPRVLSSGRGWLAVPARGGPVAISPGFGRGCLLGAVWREPSGSRHDLYLQVRGRCSLFGGRPRRNRKVAVSKPGPRGRGGHRRRAGDGRDSMQAAVRCARKADPKGEVDGSGVHGDRLTDGCGHTL
jgi:hypothetical protein